MITLVPYDPAWPRLFAEEAARLQQALGGRALRIEHVGSTAVPGLAARPVIDIQVSVASEFVEAVLEQVCRFVGANDGREQDQGH
jgi:GrpB-like predicted nucleotidyltransferase (UPF0157 family)